MLKGKPFVKWAGGKRQILDKLFMYLPPTFKNYYEPFLGGGALFFELMPKKAFLNDQNKELINVYICIKEEEKFKKMCVQLKKHQEAHSEEYYYKIRELDKNKSKFNKIVDYKRAARTLYLNKACFNGIYRVNSKNEFNVPFGKKETVNIFEDGNLKLVHCHLNYNDITFTSIDFEEAVKTARKGDFIYFDPPYDSDTSTFNDYTEGGFSKEDQKRLAKLYKKLAKKGCYVMLSNHNTKLIQELYSDYHIHVINAKRVINSRANKRTDVEEVIITNYDEYRAP